MDDLDKEKKIDLESEENLDKKNTFLNDDIKENVYKLEEELKKIQQVLQNNFQENDEKEKHITKAKNFFDSFFREHDENNPYVRILFLEVLDILNNRGEKEINYVDILKLARERFYLEMKKVLEEWTPEDIADILGEQKLAEINETIMNKKRHVIKKPQSFPNYILSSTDRGGRSNLLLK